MRRAHARGLGALVLGAALLVLAPGARAQTPVPVPVVVAPPLLTPEQEEEVKRLFEEGKQAAGVQQWNKARDRFAAAYAIKRYWPIAALLGTAEVKTLKFRDAAEHLMFCLDNATEDKLPAEGRKELMADLDLAKRHVGWLRISVDPPGAKVLVNGVELKSPLPELVFVDSGPATVEARMEGYGGDTRTVKAVVGKEAIVQLVLERTKRRSETTTMNDPGGVSSPLLSKGPSISILAVGTVAAVAGIVAGSVFAFVSNKKASEGQNLDGVICKCNDQSEFYRVQDQKVAFAGLSMWSYIGAGAVLAGTWIYGGIKLQSIKSVVKASVSVGVGHAETTIVVPW